MKKLAVLVTGAAGTLGSSTAKTLVANGYKVTLLDLPDSDGETIAKKLGDSAMFCPGDITSQKDVVNALESTKAKFGGLGTVVNCASFHKAFEIFNFTKKIPSQMDHFNEVLRVNVGGTVNVIRLAASYLSENPMDQESLRGLVINTSGFAAYDGQRGQVALAAAWGALASMTLPLCREFGNQGIRVMTIAPGLMDSNLVNCIVRQALQSISVLTPSPKRLGKKEEFANLVLAIMNNNFLNGEVIRLNGGLRLSF